MAMTVKEIQKALNLTCGFTLLCDDIPGKYTKLALRLFGKEANIPKPYRYINGKFAVDYAVVVELQQDKIWMPEALESLEVTGDTKVDLYKAGDIVNWLKSKKATCPFNEYFIWSLYTMGHRIFSINPTHALANICIESAYGTSRIARKYRNLVGMGITDNPRNRTYYKYLTFGASAYDWYSLIEKYIVRGQNTEQKLNISARRHRRDWFNIDSIARFQNYATSQTKSMVSGKLVGEINEVLNE